MFEALDTHDTTLFALRDSHTSHTTHITLNAELERLLAAARPRLQRIARLQGLAYDAAEDAAQETLVQAWRSLERLSAPDRFDAWLDGICRNIVRRRLRSDAQNARHEMPFANLLPALDIDVDEALPLEFAGAEESDPAELLSRQDLLTLLDRALALLPPATREALTLCYLSDLPQREAAARLGLSSNALEVRLHRARNQFRRLLSNELRAEAEDFGLLLDSEADSGWRETRLWCNFCGNHHLQGRFEPEPDGRVTMRMRCPECWMRYRADSVRTTDYYPGQQPRAFLPAHKKFLLRNAAFYTNAVANGYRTICPVCARHRVRLEVLRPEDVPEATYPDVRYFLYRCPDCGIGFSSISTLGAAHPVAKRFLAEHPRSVLEPETLAEYAGRPAYHFHMRDVSSAAQLTAFVDTETFAVFDIFVE
jgi:RNA polymerase sigma-70 factor (ECF subfamily)